MTMRKFSLPDSVVNKKVSQSRNSRSDGLLDFAVEQAVVIELSDSTVEVKILKMRGLEETLEVDDARGG